MTEFDTEFSTRGYLLIDEFLSEEELAPVLSSVDSLPGESAGDRRLLDHEWCRSLSNLVLERVQEKDLVRGEFVGVLCTFFDKSLDSLADRARPHP